jgi:hypothetical protein
VQLELGLAELHDGHIASAMAIFDRMIESDPNDAEAHYYYGLTLLSQNRHAEASREFAKAKSLDPQLEEAARAQADSERLAQQLRLRLRAGDISNIPSVAPIGTPADGQGKPWEVSVVAGYAYDTNVMLVDPGIPLPAGISRREDQRFTLEPHASYSLISDERLNAGVETDNYLAWQMSLDEFDTASLQAGPFVYARLTPTLSAGARYAYNYVVLDGDAYLERQIVVPQLTIEEYGGRASTSLYYQFEQRDFQGEPATPALDRSGRLHVYGIVQEVQLRGVIDPKRPLSVYLSYSYGEHRTEGTDFRGHEHTAGLTLSQYLAKWKLTVDAGVVVTAANFAHANSLDTDLRKRRDRGAEAFVMLTREIQEHVDLRARYTYTDNSSNIESPFGGRPYAYDRHQVAIELVFHF